MPITLAHTQATHNIKMSIARLHVGCSYARLWFMVVANNNLSKYVLIMNLLLCETSLGPAEIRTPLPNGRSFKNCQRMTNISFSLFLLTIGSAALGDGCQQTLTWSGILTAGREPSKTTSHRETPLDSTQRRFQALIISNSCWIHFYDCHPFFCSTNWHYHGLKSQCLVRRKST